MSLADLQKATAMLIRFPETLDTRDWSHFASEFDLDDLELKQLHAIACTKQIKKYGIKLRRFRFSDAMDSLQVLETMFGEKLLETLWFDHFEPQAAGIGADDLTHSFLKFIQSNPQVRGLLATQAPPYAASLVTYLAIESSFVNEGEVWAAKTPPANSTLAHAAFALLELDYDIPFFIRKLETEKRHTNPGLPQKRKIYYLLLQTLISELPRVFAIDKEVHTYLENQLGSPTGHEKRPAVFSDLVAAGICRS